MGGPEAILGHLRAILGRLGGILGHLGGLCGLRDPSWKPSWASWTPWRAPGTCLGADRASGRGGDACDSQRVEGGVALRRLQNPCQTALGILPRLNVPGGTVADIVRSQARARFLNCREVSSESAIPEYKQSEARARILCTVRGSRCPERRPQASRARLLNKL